MKKLSTKSLVSLLLAFTVFTTNVAPIFAANDNSDDTKTEEKDISDTTTDDSDKKEVDNAVDIDLSNVKIGDQFKDSEGITYTVDDDASNIYVGSGSNQKKYETGSISTFEITYKTKNGNATYGVNDPSAVDTYRKYIKLEDLCNLTKADGTKICEIMDATDRDAGEFYLKRLYKEKIYESVFEDKPDAREISLYYRSYHTTKSKEFKSLLQLVDENGETLDTYLFNASDETLEEAGKWESDEENNISIMTTDIETLIDNKNEVYVSLRFVSESLGAEVRWKSKEDSKDGSDDDVYIEFFDDKEYCKGIKFTITSDGDEKDPKEIEKALYMKETRLMDISLDGTYEYKDNNDKIQTSKVDWQKIYVLLTIPDSYPENFFETNIPLNERIVWKEDEKFLRVRNYVYGKYSDGQCQIGDNTYNCNLGEDVTLTGIILYRGIPIPIDIFNINDSICETNNS